MTLEEGKEAIIEALYKKADKFVNVAFQREHIASNLNQLFLLCRTILASLMLWFSLKLLTLLNEPIAPDVANLLLRMTPWLILALLIEKLTQFFQYYYSIDQIIERFINQAKDQTSKEIADKIIATALDKKLQNMVVAK